MALIRFIGRDFFDLVVRLQEVVCKVAESCEIFHGIGNAHLEMILSVKGV